MPGQIKYYKHLGKLNDEDPKSEDVHAFISSSSEAYHNMAWKTMKDRAQSRKELIIAKKDGKEIARHSFNEEVDLITELEEAKVANFSDDHLNKLKDEYGKLKTVDPSSDNYKKLIKFLDSLPQEHLAQLKNAKIPFLGRLAANRLKEDVELDEGFDKQGSWTDHPWVGKKVRAFGDKVGVVVRVRKEKTFSQMVPYVQTVWVDHGDGKAKEYLKREVRLVKEDVNLDESRVTPGSDKWGESVAVAKKSKESAEMLYNTHQNIPKKHFHQFVVDAGAKYSNPKFEKELLKAKVVNEELNEAQKSQSASHPYGLQHSEFGGREQRLRRVETWHKTSEARAKFAEKLENKDGFHEINGYHDPKGVKEDVEELDEIEKKSFIGKIMRLNTLKKKVDQSWKDISDAQKRGNNDEASKHFKRHIKYANLEHPGTWTNVKEETELDEMTSWVGKVMKDGDVHHVWQKSEGGYDYEIQNRKTGKKTYHKGSLDQLERKGYSWINEESELEESEMPTSIDESGFDYSYFAKMQAAKNRESLAKEREEKKVATRERKKHIDGMARVAKGGSYLGDRSPKEVDTSDHKLHKAFEKHLGGSFEHFESTPKHLTIKDSSGKSHAAIHAHVTHSYTHKDLGMMPGEMEDTSETHPVTAIRKNGKYEIIHGHHRGISEEVLNEKSVYQVKHDGVPADHSDKELVRLFSGKKDLINHTTSYADSAKKTAVMLKQKGFLNVRTYKDGKMLNEETESLEELSKATLGSYITGASKDAVSSGREAMAASILTHGNKDGGKQFRKITKNRLAGIETAVRKLTKEENELEENILATISKRKTAMLQKAKTSAAKVAIYGAKDHVELDKVKQRHNIQEDVIDEADNYKVPGKKMTGRGGNPSNAVERAAVKKGILPDGEENRKYNKHYLGAAAALSTRQQKSLEKGKPAVGRLEKIYKERTRDPGYRYEEVELDEGKMSELHADLGDHLDKHIATYKKQGGAEALMGHADNAAKMIAKSHGIDHVHAKKFASDYIDSALKEEMEQLDEISGQTLGSYIQKARAENKAKSEHGMELDRDPKVKEYNDKISDYHMDRRYTPSGRSVHAGKMDNLRIKIQKRKEKLDPDFPKSVIPKRYAGIRKAIEKLQSGKLTEGIEQLGEGVEVDHRSFEASHGKKARGWGRWLMCKHDRLDFDKHKEGVDYFEHTGNMRTAAEKAAKALKVKRIYVQP